MYAKYFKRVLDFLLSLIAIIILSPVLLVIAIAIKIAVLLLSALGLSTMWEAVFADVGVSVIAIINALRMLSVKKAKETIF